MTEQAKNLSVVTEISAGAGPAWVDRDLWQTLAQSVDHGEFYNAWLDLQCRQIKGACYGLVLAETEAEKTFAPAAIWPGSEEIFEPILEVARSSLDDGEAIIVDLAEEFGRETVDGKGTMGLGFPLRLQDEVLCVAAVSVETTSDTDLEQVMRQLQWGVSWLEAFFLRYRAADDEITIDRLVTALYLTARASKERTCKQAVTTLVSELSTRMDCERVSCGFMKGRKVRVESVSHTGHFGRQMNLVNAIGKAMEEAINQNATINFPEPEGNGRITHQHDALSRQQNGGAILTVPLIVEGKNVGALCFERSIAEPFDPDAVELGESVASVVGPVLREKKLNDRWIGTKIRDSFVTQVARLLGPSYLGRKLFLIGLLLVGATLFYARGDFTLTADTVLEGAEQRALVAPYDGYVATSVSRVGDQVKAGSVIATLDDTDLRLDLVEIASGRAQASSQYDEAAAAYDRARAKVFKAKVQQADARLELVNAKLERTRIVAPIDGIIVNGDLSQSLGAAVNRGEVLFELSSLYQYRVNLKVDERDISFVKPGQSVQLLLSAMPDEQIEVRVDSVTPMTVAEEGSNFFRVEATLADPEGVLRPGMEGVAKIMVDERRYIWIWTRKLVNRVKLWLWRWVD